MVTTRIVNYFKRKYRNTSYDAVSTYIRYSEDSFLIHRCDRYDINRKETQVKTATYYINDLSYRNFLYPGFVYDVGYKLRKLIFLEMRRARYMIYIGVAKDKEVDDKLFKHTSEFKYSMDRTNSPVYRLLEQSANNELFLMKILNNDYCHEDVKK